MNLNYPGNRHKPTFSQFLARVQRKLMDKHTGKGVGKVKLDRKKYELARARACKGQKELEAEGIPKGTLCRAMSGRGVKPETLGRIAKALGVDVTEILADE